MPLTESGFTAFCQLISVFCGSVGYRGCASRTKLGVLMIFTDMLVMSPAANALWCGARHDGYGYTGIFNTGIAVSGTLFNGYL